MMLVRQPPTNSGLLGLIAWLSCTCSVIALKMIYVWSQEYGKKQYSAQMCTRAPGSLFGGYILILKVDHVSLERTGKIVLWSNTRRRGMANMERMRTFVLLCFHQVSIYSKWISSHPARSSSETGSRIYQQSASWRRTKGMNKHP